MNNFDKIVTYHGTSKVHAQNIVNGKIDVSLGGGELGKGFYLGNELYVAKAWATQMHNCESVVEIQINDNDFYDFDILCLNRLEALENRQIIRNSGQTRTYEFLKDIVWSPIVGGAEVYADQHKWESKTGENYLNGNKVLRRIR